MESPFAMDSVMVFILLMQWPIEQRPSLMFGIILEAFCVPCITALPL